MFLRFNPFPTLSTARLLLRKITEADAPALFALRSDERLMQYIDRPRARNLNDALELVRRLESDLLNTNGITWGISLNDDPTTTLIGTIGFWRIEKANHRAEIGYMLHPAHQRKGLIQEAIQTVMDYGFTELRLHSVQANVNPANAASALLLEKNGFKKEAHFRENFFFDGKFLDSIIYSKLATD